MNWNYYFDIKEKKYNFQSWQNHSILTMLKFVLVVWSFFFAQLCSAGVKHMGSKVDMHELEKLVEESNNQELIDEIGDVKILHEKSVSLREGFFIAEADALDKRIHNKVCGWFIVCFWILRVTDL